MFDQYRKMNTEVKGLFLNFLLLRVVFEIPIMFVVGVYIDFLMQHGLSLLEKNLVNTAFFGTMLIGEIPTGLFTDIHGRKKSGMLASGLMAVALLSYSYAQTFWWFVFSEMLLGFGRCFANGIFATWFEDGLRFYGQEKMVKRSYVQGAGTIVAKGALLIASTIGGVIAARYGQPVLFFIGSFLMLGAMVVIYLRMRDFAFERKEKIAIENLSQLVRYTILKYRDTFKKARHTFKKDRQLAALFYLFLVYMFCTQSLNMDWQPWFRSLGFGLDTLGFYFGVMMVFVAVGGLLLLRGVFDTDRVDLFFTARMILGLLVVAVIVCAQLHFIYAAMLFFLLHEIPRGVFESAISAFYTPRTETETRATIGSCIFQAGHIGAVLGLVTSGLVSQHCGILCSWTVSAAVLIVAPIFIYYRIIKHDT